MHSVGLDNDDRPGNPKARHVSVNQGEIVRFRPAWSMTERLAAPPTCAGTSPHPHEEAQTRPGWRHNVELQISRPGSGVFI